MVKKILGIITTFVFGGIGIFCMVYYFGKFYIEGSLNFEHNILIWFSIVCAMIIMSLVCSMIMYINMSNQISHLSKEVELYHYSEMSSIKSNMECILDLDERGK